MRMFRKNKRLPITGSGKFILSDETPSAVREAYRAAITKLVVSLSASEMKTVVVTSCSPSEGKSTSCLNMALSMAQTGADVLLIDADMRKPVMHRLLCLDNKVGLSSVLGSGETDVTKAIDTDVRDHLDVLSSGPIPPNPAELISGDRTDRLLKLASKRYDYVFIDTPPVNAVTDAFLFNSRTAGMIFVVKEGSTTHEDIRGALSKAELTGGNVLGFIKTNFSGKGCKRRSWSKK